MENTEPTEATKPTKPTRRFVAWGDDIRDAVGLIGLVSRSFPDPLTMDMTPHSHTV